MPHGTIDVLLVGASDLSGGAARAAYRLHRGLSSRKKVRSRFLVQHKDSDDPSVLGPSSSLSRLTGKVRRATGETLSNLLPGEVSGKRSLNIVPSGLHRSINALDPDVVHLHWIGYETISINEIAKIEPPVVWTLHDMWAFSGTRHYSGHQKNVDPEVESDTLPPASTPVWVDRQLRRYKKKTWSSVEMTIVTPSDWLAREARRSAVLGEKPIRQIPNGINTDTYKPLNASVARSAFQLPQDSPLVLFGAINALDDPRKGGHLLRSAIQDLIDHRPEVELVIFGTSREEAAQQFDTQVHYVGRLRDDYSLALLYSAADVFALPSTQDNLPNTIMEAMACGTPCVGFEVGGVAEMIDHEATGYVAHPFDTSDLAQGLHWVLNEQHRASLSDAAREKVCSLYSLPKVTERYVDSYRLVVERKDPS